MCLVDHLEVLLMFNCLTLTLDLCKKWKVTSNSSRFFFFGEHRSKLAVYVS